MVWIASARRVVWLALLCAPLVHAQTQIQQSATTLPPTTPTALAATTATPAPAPIAIPPAEIHFSDGKLRVLASGSSLNEIIREISRLTSINITGSVNDEPVYGTYGPSSPGEVIADLLDGTGTNMLLRESTPTRNGQLILSRRDGTVSPPNPSAAGFDNNPNLPPRQSYQRPPSYPTPPQQVNGGQPSPPGAATPNGPQTPEQIYQQLQRIQQAQPHP